MVCKTEIPRSSILGNFFFLIYSNSDDMSDDILSTVKFFADYTLVFSTVHNSNTSTNETNKDMKSVSEWAHKWKV